MVGKGKRGLRVLGSGREHLCWYFDPVVGLFQRKGAKARSGAIGRKQCASASEEWSRRLKRPMNRRASRFPVFSQNPQGVVRVAGTDWLPAVSTAMTRYVLGTPGLP
jgi:hypothetical protein